MTGLAAVAEVEQRIAAIRAAGRAPFGPLAPAGSAGTSGSPEATGPGSFDAALTRALAAGTSGSRAPDPSTPGEPAAAPPCCCGRCAPSAAGTPEAAWSRTASTGAAVPPVGPGGSWSPTGASSGSPARGLSWSLAAAGRTVVPWAGGTGDVPYADLFAAAGARHGIPPALLAAVARAESGFDPRAVSRAGAQGLMQIMPATARGLGVDPLVPEQAVDGAARLLAGHLERFGSVELALAAYNAGGGAVARYGGVPPYEETRAYVARILADLGGPSWTP
ncbi:MAG: lytic transglycosylase domain-containing protein [Acidimicrobiia bacterium]